jgi:hypothetical protein
MTSEIATHAMLRLEEDRLLAPTRPARLALARAVFRTVPRDRLFVFRCADTHLHLLLHLPREGAGEVARRLEISLQRTLDLDTPFQRAHFRPVRDPFHLQSAFLYILRQEARHGLTPDPLHEAGSLLDLLGLRICGAHTLPLVRANLPRLRSEDLHTILGSAPAIPDFFDLSAAPEATAAAVGLPDLLCLNVEASRARVAAARLLAGHYRDADIARALGASERSFRRWKALPPMPDLERAVALQIGLRARQGQRAGE